MTIREGWPSFGQWQQNVALRRQMRSMREAVVELTIDLSRFNEVVKSATNAMTKLRVMVDNGELGYTRNPYLADSQEWWDS